MDEETGWLSAKIECDLCSHEWLALYHESSDELECPNCKNINEYFEEKEIK